MNARLIVTVPAMAANAIVTAIDVCFVGAGFTFLSAAVFAGWLGIWSWEKRR